MAKRTNHRPAKADKAFIEARDALIREQTLELFAALKELTPPPGHAWELSRSWDSWFGGSLEASCRSGISIMLRSEADFREPDQLHGEIRLHRGALQDFRYRPEGAIVWFERGSRLAGSPRIDHVVAESSYVECDGPDTTSIVRDSEESPLRLEKGTRVVGPAPMTGRHVHAGSWDAMTRHILASVRIMLARDAACVANGDAVPAGHDHERLAA